MYRQKKGGGGRKHAVSPQCEVRLKMTTADFEIMRLTAQPHCKICIFFKPGAKNFRKRGKCTQKKKSDPKSPVNRDDAEGDWASARKNTSRRQAKNFDRFESHTQHLSNEDESGRLQPDL